MSPRKDFGGTKVMYKNEHQFNNFYLNSPSNKSLSFKKYLTRPGIATENPETHKTLDIDKAIKAN